MATPEYDILKMAQKVLEDSEYIRDILEEHGVSAINELPAEVYESVENLIVDHFPKNVALAEVLVGYFGGE